MAQIMITKIDTDCSEIRLSENPMIRRKNINRVFAVADTFDNHAVAGTLEVNLTPDEQELFNELTKRITARISIEVTK